MANIKIRTRPSTSSDLVRPRPQDDAQFGLWVSDHDKFAAYVHADVLEFIKKNGNTAAPYETIGLLAGRVCRDLLYGPYVLVMAAENAVDGEFEAGQGHVKLKGDRQTHVRRRLEDAHPDREIIGWYHSHPNWGPTFSEVDAWEQKTWNDQNSIGIVYSTNNGGEFGVYRGPDPLPLRAVSIPKPKTVQKRTGPLAPQVPAATLTPRPEPLKAEENIVTSTPAARLTKIQIAVAVVVILVWLAQIYSIYRLDRRLAFAEGRLHQLSATFSALERPTAQGPAELSSSNSSRLETSTSQPDGPDLHVPVKPLIAAPTSLQQPVSTHSRVPTKSPARRTALNNKRKNNGGKKSEPAKPDRKEKPPASAASTDPKPGNDPKPKATPK